MVGVQCDMLCTQNIVLLLRDVGWLLRKCEVAFLNILISMLQLP